MTKCGNNFEQIYGNSQTIQCIDLSSFQCLEKYFRLEFGNEQLQLRERKMAKSRNLHTTDLKTKTLKQSVSPMQKKCERNEWRKNRHLNENDKI